MYSKMLAIPQNKNELQKLIENSNNFVMKSLLRTKRSHYSKNDAKAIQQLKEIKSQLKEYMAQSLPLQEKKSCRKAIIQVQANLISRQFRQKQFEECNTSFNQLCEFINQISQLRQALYNLFELNSLVTLNNYNMNNNAQFKYNANIQVDFFYILGKIKIANNKTQQAKIAFQKIVAFKNSTQINEYMKLRVYDYLSDIKLNTYNQECEKIRKASPQNIQISFQEKQCCSKIIKDLIRKEIQLTTDQQSQKEQQKICMMNKKMFLHYLNMSNILEKGQNEQDSKLKNFASAIGKQQNPNVIKEILQSSVGKKAIQFYQIKMDRVQNILTKKKKYYFYRLVYQATKQSAISINIPNSQIKKNFSEALSEQQVERGSEYSKIKPFVSKMSKLPLASIYPNQMEVKTEKDRRKVPHDTNLAQQILKKCGKGSFLMKINFSNSSIKKKFVKIGAKELVWSDSQSNIDEGSTIKWKHVLGVVYGKVSPNLTKKKFQHLQPWKCFSLISQDRSFDFYCEQESEIYFWLQGLSYQLQLFHRNFNTYPFYSKGRSLWKMSFLKMNVRYYKKNKSRKFKNQNAGAVISFNSLNQSNSNKSKMKKMKGKSVI